MLTLSRSGGAFFCAPRRISDTETNRAPRRLVGGLPPMLEPRDEATGENLIEQPSPVPVLFGLALRFHPLKDLLAVFLERAKALVQGVLNRFSRCCGAAS